MTSRRAITRCHPDRDPGSDRPCRPAATARWGWGRGVRNGRTIPVVRSGSIRTDQCRMSVVVLGTGRATMPCSPSQTGSACAFQKSAAHRAERSPPLPRSGACSAASSGDAGSDPSGQPARTTGADPRVAGARRDLIPSAKFPHIGPFLRRQHDEFLSTVHGTLHAGWDVYHVPVLV